MCVLVGPKVVINNAFYAKKVKRQSFLALEELREFCNILYNTITGENGSGARYKYVCFQVDASDIEDFCDENAQFVRGIRKVYCTREVQEETVKEINSIYPEEMQMMLETARMEFAKAAV